MSDPQALLLKRFTGVVNSGEKMLTEMDATRRTGKGIGGYYPSLDPGPVFPCVRSLIPEPRLTDQGLMDATNSPFLPVVQGPAE